MVGRLAMTCGMALNNCDTLIGSPQGSVDCVISLTRDTTSLEFAHINTMQCWAILDKITKRVWIRLTRAWASLIDGNMNGSCYSEPPWSHVPWLLSSKPANDHCKGEFWAIRSMQVPGSDVNARSGTAATIIHGSREVVNVIFWVESCRRVNGDISELSSVSADDTHGPGTSVSLNDVEAHKILKRHRLFRVF